MITPWSCGLFSYACILYWTWPGHGNNVPCGKILASWAVFRYALFVNFLLHTNNVDICCSCWGGFVFLFFFSREVAIISQWQTSIIEPSLSIFMSILFLFHLLSWDNGFFPIWEIDGSWLPNKSSKKKRDDKDLWFRYYFFLHFHSISLPYFVQIFGAKNTASFHSWRFPSFRFFIESNL